MTIKENPLEEDKFSLAIAQLKTEEITQCIYIFFFFPRTVQYQITLCHTLS